jgi:hypothetical protein
LPPLRVSLSLPFHENCGVKLRTKPSGGEKKAQSDEESKDEKRKILIVKGNKKKRTGISFPAAD